MKKFHKKYQANATRAIRKRVKKNLGITLRWIKEDIDLVNHYTYFGYDEETILNIKEQIEENMKDVPFYRKIAGLSDAGIFKLSFKIKDDSMIHCVKTLGDDFFSNKTVSHN